MGRQARQSLWPQESNHFGDRGKVDLGLLLITLYIATHTEQMLIAGRDYAVVKETRFIDWAN